MKINISIKSNPAELAELLKVTQGERDVVQEALDYLEKKISNQVTCHIPADHMETGTVIQGKPTREPGAAADIQPGDLVKVQWPKDWNMPDEWNVVKDKTYRVEGLIPRTSAFVRPAGTDTLLPFIAEVGWLSRVEPEPAADSEYRVGDLVELHWEGKKSDSPNVLYRITELHDNGTVSLRPNTFPSFELFNISKEWISRPLRKVELRGDDEWIVPDTVSPQPTPPRPMRSFDTRIQTGDIVIIQPFTGHNEIFVVLSANNEKALLHSENNEIKIVDLYKLLRVWPDPESVYGVYCGAIAVEPPKE